MEVVGLLGCAIAVLAVPTGAGVPGIDCAANPGRPECEAASAGHRVSKNTVNIHMRGGQVHNTVEIFDDEEGEQCESFGSQTASPSRLPLARAAAAAAAAARPLSA